MTARARLRALFWPLRIERDMHCELDLRQSVPNRPMPQGITVRIGSADEVIQAADMRHRDAGENVHAEFEDRLRRGQTCFVAIRCDEVVGCNWLAFGIDHEGPVRIVLRDDEVLFILTYGRPYSPMSPWGLAGGGPMNDQQLTNLLAYLHSIQLPQEGCTAANPLCKGKDGTLNAATQAQIVVEAQKQVDNGTYKSLAEALFANPLSGGAFSCARCHTKGWSYGDPQVPAGGAMGPSLVGGAAVRQFPNEEDQVAFIKAGSELGKKYGAQGQGSGKMPGFGQLLTDDEIRQIVEWERSR